MKATTPNPHPSLATTASTRASTRPSWMSTQKSVTSTKVLGDKSRRSTFRGQGLKVGSKDHLSKSAPSADADSVTSFNEIVQLDDEGHPFIDINRLVYHPHKHAPSNAPHLRKEKISWYLPDFSFILLNLLSLCCSTYFVISGITTLTWVSSMGMFSLPDCEKLINSESQVTGSASGLANAKEENFYFLPCVEFLRDMDKKFKYNNTGYNFTRNNHDFYLIKTKLTNVQTFGIGLIGLQIINLLSVLVGIHACLEGHRKVLAHHITVDGIIVLGEFAVSSIICFTGVCDGRELEVIRMILRYHIRWYDNILKDPEDETDKEKIINTQVDELQIQLGCCGADSWLDYLPADWPYWYWPQTHSDLNDGEMVIPYSCCRSWWLRNVYCSHGAHLWAHPSAPPEKLHQFEERINQEGCIYKLEQICERIRVFMGKWALFATIAHLVFIVLEGVAAQVLIKNINDMILENKKIMKRKEMTHDAGADASEIDLTLTMTGLSASMANSDNKVWTTIPPPTEDEIMTIKLRSNFNRFMAHVRDNVVGDWMREAHLIVTKGQDEPEKEDETEEERKQREKLLLKGPKPKKEYLEHLGGAEDGEGAEGDQAKLHKKKHPKQKPKAPPKKGHKKKGKADEQKPGEAETEGATDERPSTDIDADSEGSEGEGKQKPPPPPPPKPTKSKKLKKPLSKKEKDALKRLVKGKKPQRYVPPESDSDILLEGETTEGEDDDADVDEEEKRRRKKQKRWRLRKMYIKRYKKRKEKAPVPLGYRVPWNNFF